MANTPKRDSPEPMQSETPESDRVVRARALTLSERETLCSALLGLASDYLRRVADPATLAHAYMDLYGLAKVEVRAIGDVFYADSGRLENTVHAKQMLDMWTVFREVDAEGKPGSPGPAFAVYTQNKTDGDAQHARMDLTKLNPEQCTVRLDMLQYRVDGAWHPLFSAPVYTAMAREMILAYAASPAGRADVTTPEVFDAKVLVMTKRVEETLLQYRNASCPAYFNQTVTVGNKGKDHAVTLRILNRKPTAGPHAGFDVIATSLPNLDTSFEVREVQSFKEVGLNRLVPSASSGAGVERMAHALLAQNTETAYEAVAMAEQVRAQRAQRAQRTAPSLQQSRTIFGGDLESTGFFATASVFTFGLKRAPVAGGGQGKSATRSCGARGVTRGGGRAMRDDDLDGDEIEVEAGFQPRMVATNVVPGPLIGPIDSAIALDPTLPCNVVELDGVVIKGIMNAALEVDGVDPLRPMSQDAFDEHMSNVLNLARGWKKALVTQIERYNRAGAPVRFCGVQQAVAGVLLREADATEGDRAMIAANCRMRAADELHAMEVEDTTKAEAEAEAARLAAGMRAWAEELVVSRERTLCVCPISQELMRDPVLVGEQAYDRHGIEQWLAACRRGNRPPTCPLTRRVFASANVASVRMLKAQAEKDVAAMLTELEASGEALPAGFLPPPAPLPLVSSVHREHDRLRMLATYKASPMLDTFGHCDEPLGQNGPPITFLLCVREHDGKDDDEGEMLLPVTIGARDAQGALLPDEAAAWTANAVERERQDADALRVVRRVTYRPRRRMPPRKETLYMFKSTDAIKVFGFKPTEGMLVRVTIANAGGQDVAIVPTYLHVDGQFDVEDTMHLCPQEECELTYPLQKEAGEGTDSWVLQFSDAYGNQCGVALVFEE